jgi:uncharacterized repeat protein (TIGR01451 family)
VGPSPFAFAVTNTTPVAATGVIVTDTLPAGLSFVSSPDGCTSTDGTTITCDLGTVAANTTVTVSVVTLADDPFPTDDVIAAATVPNTATVTSPGTNCPPTVARVQCSSTIDVPLQPQLTLSKTSTATQIVPGDEVPYAFTVTNTTPALAADVTVTDTLPAGLTFVSSPDACTSADGTTITCDLGDLPPGASVTVSVVTEAAVPFPAAGVDATGGVANTASVTSPDTNCPPGAPDPAAACTSTETVPLQPQLSIVKSTAADFIVPGEQATFTFTVTNTTPTAAAGVTVTDTLPTGLTFVSSPDGCTSPDTVTVTCPLGVVPAGSTATADVVVVAADPFPAAGVNAAGNVANTASVTSPGTNCPPGAPDPAPACDSTLEVPLDAQLTIQKATTATQIVPGGGEVPFSYTVTNTTPVEAIEVIVTDVLPAGLTFVRSDGCSSADGVTITCDVGTLAAASTVTLDVVVQAADPFPADDVTPGGGRPEHRVGDVAGHELPAGRGYSGPGVLLDRGGAAPAADCDREDVLGDTDRAGRRGAVRVHGGQPVPGCRHRGGGDRPPAGGPDVRVVARRLHVTRHGDGHVRPGDVGGRGRGDREA